MNNKKLIKFYSESEHMVHCACCDGESFLVKEWYQELVNEKEIGFNKYLECCKDSVGNVVDWCDYEDYKTPVGKDKRYGINIIKGYVKN